MDNYVLALRAVREAPSDPENTLQLAITMKELALIMFGMHLISDHFDEPTFVLADFLEKLDEVITAQEFFSWWVAPHG
jgi:hypothetical protein